MGSQGEEGLVGPREAPHSPRSPRAFGPQSEVFSKLNPNPSWGPVTPHEAHAVRKAQASGVLADPKLRGQRESHRTGTLVPGPRRCSSCL